MSEQSQVKSPPSTSSSADSHAKTCPSQAPERDWRVKSPVYSGKCTVSLCSLDPESSSWRTLQASLLSMEQFVLFAGRFPKQGTISSGECYELTTPAWEHPTDESAGSASHTWPTPKANERGGWQRDKGGRIYPTLSGAVGVLQAAPTEWPTPTAKTFDQDPETFDKRSARMALKWKNGNGAGRLLAVEVKREWPTPTATLGTSGQKSRGGSRKDELLLTGMAMKTWPTPVASDHRNAELPPSHMNRDSVPGEILRQNLQMEQQRQQQSLLTAEEAENMMSMSMLRDADPVLPKAKLNACWVEALMGFPQGWTSLSTDGQLHQDHTSTSGSHPEPSKALTQTDASD